MAYKNTIHLEAFYSCVLWDTIPGTMATHEMEFLLTTTLGHGLWHLQTIATTYI